MNGAGQHSSVLEVQSDKAIKQPAQRIIHQSYEHLCRTHQRQVSRIKYLHMILNDRSSLRCWQQTECAPGHMCMPSLTASHNGYLHSESCHYISLSFLQLHRWPSNFIQVKKIPKEKWNNGLLRNIQIKRDQKYINTLNFIQTVHLPISANLE